MLNVLSEDSFKNHELIAKPFRQNSNSWLTKLMIFEMLLLDVYMVPSSGYNLRRLRTTTLT